MANQEALLKIAFNMRIIEQNERAITWLEGYRESWNKAPGDHAFQINANTRGSGLTGWSDAQFRLNDFFGPLTLTAINEALTECRRFNLDAAEEIKLWSTRL